MNIDTIKIELIDWIARLNDQQAINEVLNLKQILTNPKPNQNIEIFGSGKHLIDYISDDFNEPLDMFKEYQK